VSRSPAKPPDFVTVTSSPRGEAAGEDGGGAAGEDGGRAAGDGVRAGDDGGGGGAAGDDDGGTPGDEGGGVEPAPEVLPHPAVTSNNRPRMSHRPREPVDITLMTVNQTGVSCPAGEPSAR
jgi:hypothetical protein